MAELKLICVNSDLELDQSITTAGTAVITSSPSSYEKIDGKGIYAGDVTVSVSGFKGGNISDGGGYVVTTPGSGTDTLSPSSDSCKAGGEYVLREGDNVDVTVSGIITNSTNPQDTRTVTQTVNVKISDAGQSYIKSY